MDPRLSTGTKRTPWILWGLAAYVLLLGASHAVRHFRAGPRILASGDQETRVPRLAIERSLGGPTGNGAAEIRIVWREHGIEHGDNLPVVLLHGSPGRKTNLEAIATALSSERRVLSPDLPGFGSSRDPIPDYSIRSHAGYVFELLDAIGIDRVHVVGYSMGGGVGLEMCAQQAERVASLTMLSSIGVQELELFGNYTLNHALHSLQVALLLAVHEGMPHFGALDDSIISVAYARNFHDSDQRPLRTALENWDGPTLVLHGKSDSLVPAAAALEHHRLVPQSELMMLAGGHMLAFTDSDDLAARVAPFLDRAEGGRALTRATAPADRVAAAALPFDITGVPPLAGIALVLFCLLVASATLVSEDLTCIAVGAMVAQGRIPFLAGAAACVAGIYIGDMLLFLAGRTLGRKALGRRPLRWFLSDERVERGSEWFRRRGPIVIFLSRFTPGARLPTYFAAGCLRTSTLRFAFWFALASLAWSPLLVWLSSQIGGELLDRVDLLQRNLFIGVVACIVVVMGVRKLLVPALHYRGRRLLVSRWRRLTRWEFWPRGVVYAPVALYALWLGLKHRCMTAFTAANPAIPASGFIGESKGDILQALDRVPATRRFDGTLPLERQVRAAQAFMKASGMEWPVVVKPDVGQRGDGVAIVRSIEELRSACQAIPGDALVQEYVAGVEYGLLYVRRPAEERGWIFSAVEKRMPTVRGDGSRTLERLILADKRAVCMAPFYLTAHADKLGAVPGPGEVVSLGELGTHCRGATFLDGFDIVTPELESALDELARSYPGFHFGRFDIRSPSKADLSAGRFSILELNGVTSEAGHIYDPSHSLWGAWGTLCRQWSLAFEIGAANARAGAPVTGPRQLLASLFNYRRRTPRADHPSAGIDERGLSASGSAISIRSEKPCVR